MMNRLRTVLVSVTAVAVAMMVLGSNARAKSVRTASQQKYLRLLERLAKTERLAKAEIKTGTSLTNRYNSLEKTINRLENIPHPSPRLARRIATEIATLSKQESRVFASLQKNTNALLTTEDLLLAQYQALPSPTTASICRHGPRSQRVIRKDSEVRNRGGGTVSPPHPSGCSAISDRGARQQSDDSRNRIPLFLPAVKLRVDRVSPRCSLPAFLHGVVERSCRQGSDGKLLPMPPSSLSCRPLPSRRSDMAA